MLVTHIVILYTGNIWQTMQVKAILLVGKIVKKLQSVHMPYTFSVYLWILAGKFLVNGSQFFPYQIFPCTVYYLSCDWLCSCICDQICKTVLLGTQILIPNFDFIAWNGHKISSLLNISSYLKVKFLATTYSSSLLTLRKLEYQSVMFERSTLSI